MSKYRKRPVVVEAIQFQLNRWDTIHDWLTEHGYGPTSPTPVEGVMLRTDTDPVQVDDRVPEFSATIVGTEPGLAIPTTEGVMYARPGDWLIIGVEGEIYPCKASVFAATYEEVSSSPPLSTAELYDSFVRYAQHVPTCATRRSSSPSRPECDCGFDDVLTRLVQNGALE